MKNLKHIIIGMAGIGILGACNRDFLNTKPLNQIPSDVTWKDAGLCDRTAPTLNSPSSS